MSKRLTDAEIDALVYTYGHISSIRFLLEEVKRSREVEPLLLDACHEVCMTIAHAPASQLAQKINAAYEKCKAAIARAEKEGKNR